LLGRLHALCGVVPLGAFLILHLWQQGASLQGRQRYEQALVLEPPLAMPVLEACGLYAPLLFHAAYGVKLAGRARGGSGVARAGLGPAAPEAQAWASVQRWSAWPLLGFLALHLWQFGFRSWTGELTRSDFFPELCASLSSTIWGGLPLMAIAYLLGVLAAALHFYNGLCGFCWTWGIVQSARALRLTRVVVGLGAAALCMLGTLTVIDLATGSSFGLGAAR
jgi:succinate dehydrogenase/fumarate reductase cytochrome b subunit